jgi:2-polyprenyl-3-methyl-5-hydroxy-6-metoxy-1,4-benzoquinol methylase
VEVKEPAKLVVCAASLLKPGRALDLACGGGRHATWLHQHGWKVTAVDRNVETIAKLQHDWPAIDARVVDLEQSAFAIEPGAYDLVVCWLYHQPDLYPRIRRALRPGGMAALCALLEGRFAAEPGELQNHFPGWTTIETETSSACEHRPATQLLACAPM